MNERFLIFPPQVEPIPRKMNTCDLIICWIALFKNGENKIKCLNPLFRIAALKMFEYNAGRSWKEKGRGEWYSVSGGGGVSHG